MRRVMLAGASVRPVGDGLRVALDVEGVNVAGSAGVSFGRSGRLLNALRLSDLRVQ
jgi:hypothetical protein